MAKHRVRDAEAKAEEKRLEAAAGGKWLDAKKNPQQYIAALLERIADFEEQQEHGWRRWSKMERETITRLEMRIGDLDLVAVKMRRRNKKLDERRAVLLDEVARLTDGLRTFLTE